MRKLTSFIGLVTAPVVALVLLAAPAAMSASSTDGPNMAADGKALFLANKCDACHSVTAKSVECAKPAHFEKDLSAVTDDAAFVKKFLKKEVTKKETKDGVDKEVKHKKMWSGSEEDLDAILAWLGIK